MRQFKKILVATDTRFKDRHAVVEAVKLAKDNHAQLTIVDVLPDFSWPVRLAVKDHDHVVGLIAEEKSKVLNEIAEPLIAEGLDVKTNVLRGHSSVELIREVLREKSDLLIRVTKGRESRESGYFGRTGKRLLRKCPCPVWLIPPDFSSRYQNIAACIDTSSNDQIDIDLNNAILGLASAVASTHKSQLSVVHAWSIWNEGMLKSHMSKDDFTELQTNAHDQAEAMLHKYLDRHHPDITQEQVRLLKGEPSIVVPEFARQQKVDLFVMGTVGRSGLTGVLMGNTAERILDRLECSLLAIKPTGFQCPIHLEF